MNPARPSRCAPVWALMIVGQFPEPYLEAALRSVDWVDGVAVVNTDPEGLRGLENERTVRRVVPREKLRLAHLPMGKFDFAKARNKALDLIPAGAYALKLDSDDVHYPEFRDIVWGAILDGHDMLSTHFFHLAVYKDLLHSQPYQELVFSTGPGVRFRNTQGTVHEELEHPRQNARLLDYSYVHYGYVRPAREVARKWEFYRSLGAPIHEYDRDQPDRALDDWPRICTPFWREHPPAVREVLAGLPSAPSRRREGRPRVGLVMLTWNDAENLAEALASLSATYEPFALVAIDNGSEDDSVPLLRAFGIQTGHPVRVLTPDAQLPLAEALNLGFRTLLDVPDLDYIGWIHPDHVFEWPDWLGKLVAEMDAHPEWAKLGAWEVGTGREDEAWPGNSQCYIVRRGALEAVGLFDPQFIGIGGFEDWDANRRLLEVGKVMITPEATVRHIGMATRGRRDTSAEARANAEYYCKKWGDNDPPV